MSCIDKFKVLDREKKLIMPFEKLEAGDNRILELLDEIRTYVMIEMLKSCGEMLRWKTSCDVSCKHTHQRVCLTPGSLQPIGDRKSVV